MAERQKLTPQKHKEQIEAYIAVRPYYVAYAKTLARVLGEACRVSFPEAFIQSRAKAVSSFAEKAARKFDKYPDAANQMTDLCGARVIVQTTEQVKAVRRFIEANFLPVEIEDKGLLLSEDEFGYRDMHYIVQLRTDRDDILGITPEERAQILDRKAEIQVRTWVQHAWADTLHDRIYKNKLKISSEAKRTGNLLAALMEEGDRNFNQLADELDGLIANYTAVAPKKEIQEEIKIQELILGNETDIRKKPGLAMKLARLVAASGDSARVVELLAPHEGIEDGNRCELLLDLGFGLCRVHRHSPASPDYERGRTYLEKALELCECSEVTSVPHLRKCESLHARALSRLGWSLEVFPGEVPQAREYYRRAHEHEPANPYYLAQMLGLEMSCGNRAGLPASMRTTIREAAKTCDQHAIAGIELPYAYFIAGRLNLLLDKPYDALGYYARGIRHCLAGVHCVPADILSSEMDWLTHIHHGVKIPREHQYAVDLLALGREIEAGPKAPADSPLRPPVLIIAGGAETMTSATLTRIRPLVLMGLAEFQGTIIAGGTTVGVPGLTGDIARQLAEKNNKRFQLVGYLPTRLPHGVSAHEGYDLTINTADDFLPDQILRNWRDILTAGINPRDVMLLGFGGGPLSAVEYRIALGLGASVGIVSDTAGKANELVNDPLWSAVSNLYPLPADPTTVRAFVISANHALEPAIQEEMAESFHNQYVGTSGHRLPANMRPWPDLDETFKKANREQAKYSIEILEAAGFGVRKVAGTPTIFEDFTDGEVECMAEMEHGRWNVERLRDGWRYGLPRDDSRKTHDCLVPWSTLPEGIKKYDRESVRVFPKILSQAGLEVFRR